MKDDNPQTLTPRLRFPEFRKLSGWVEKSLSSACEINPDNNGIPESFVYVDLESVDSGKLVARKVIKREGAPSRAQRLLRRGDVIYQTVRPYQRNNLYFDADDGHEYVASTGYAQLRAHDSPAFLYQLIHTDSFVNRVLAECSGSSYPAINSSDLAAIEVAVPSPAEQRKIAECLGSLDELIAAEGRKLEGLRAHKKGLMQHLFPRDSETRPRLRFPEFRERGEWEETPLKSLADYENGKAYEQDISADGRFIVVNSRFVSTDGAVRKFTNAEYCTATQGDVLMVLSDLPNGKALAKCFLVDLDDRYAVNQRVAKLTPSIADSAFLYYRLNRHANLLAFDDGLSQTHLSKGSVLDCLLCVPNELAEQQRIAACLSSLDAVLSGQSQKLSALRTHKQALMQQLFPSGDPQ